MINPINKPADLNQSVQTEQNASTKTNAKPTSDSNEQPKEQIHLSEAFREIEKLREVIDNTAEINHTRIEYLKSLIDSGEYQINSQTIVDRFMNEE